ncbi:hypothetical protein CISG_07802 [Coccidioides immitis RMSCC 3703]|uniref:Uncharacterized protein n=1 Tax=Coccidioides immitis RMSCC 3703 TaxID=454286 RepID=A0A0J8R6M8_COCIT|nr:hypothetical protein CISG_07802 [Coccidioides immitis RMSCC 3703]
MPEHGSVLKKKLRDRCFWLSYRCQGGKPQCQPIVAEDRHQLCPQGEYVRVIKSGSLSQSESAQKVKRRQKGPEQLASPWIPCRRQGNISRAKQGPRQVANFTHTI